MLAARDGPPSALFGVRHEAQRVRLQNQLEALLEEGRTKLSSVISDLLGLSGRRIVQAMADGETDPGRLHPALLGAARDPLWRGSLVPRRLDRFGTVSALSLAHSPADVGFWHP